MTRSQRWLSFAIVALAFALRASAPEFKPPHFDEGVNGSLVDGMRTTGHYHYNPENFHGPLHFYALFIAQTLLGREVWALRLPTILIGTAAVALIFAFRRFFSFRAVAYAAAFLAISPAMVFYSRYAIHEMWLPFFALLALHGGFAVARGEARKADLWRLGAGITGMILTKETWLLHAIAALLAMFAVWLTGQFGSGESGTRARRPADVFSGEEENENPPREGAWTAGDAAQVALVCYGVLLAFYSGFGFDWSGVRGMFTTFAPMAEKGTTGEEGHNKEFFYFAKLLTHYEWPATAGIIAAALLALWRSALAGIIVVVLGLAGAATFILVHAGAPGIPEVNEHLRPFLGLDTKSSLALAAALVGFCFFFATPSRDRLVRALAFYTLASLAAYSLIPYKTPWCLVNVIAPACLLLGIALDRLSAAANAWVVTLVAALLAVPSAQDTRRLNFIAPNDDRLPRMHTIPLAARLDHKVKADWHYDGDRYAYVQTTFDIHKLLRPVRALIALDARHRRITGHVIGDAFPLIWLLNDFPRIQYLHEDAELPRPDADFLIVPEHRVADIEAELRDIYFKEPYRPRNGAEDCQLYLHAARFADVLPGREPEFLPRRPHQPQPPPR